MGHFLPEKSVNACFVINFNHLLLVSVFYIIIFSALLVVTSQQLFVGSKEAETH